MKTGDFFDKRFVFSAVLLGVAFALVMVLSGMVFGKDAASVVGIGLGAALVGILKKFEKLKFKRLPESRIKVVPIPKFDPWNLLTSLFIFFLAQVICGVVLGFVLLPLEWNQLGRYTGSEPDLFWLIFRDVLANRITRSAAMFATGLSYFVGGFFIGRFTPNRRFDAVIGSFTFAILSVFVGLLVMTSFLQTSKLIPLTIVRSGVIDIGLYCSGFIGISYIGAGYGATKQQSPPSTRPKRVKGLKRVRPAR